MKRKILATTLGVILGVTAGIAVPAHAEGPTRGTITLIGHIVYAGCETGVFNRAHGELHLNDCRGGVPVVTMYRMDDVKGPAAAAPLAHTARLEAIPGGKGIDARYGPDKDAVAGRHAVYLVTYN